MTSFVKYLIVALYLVLPFCVSGENNWPTKGGNGGRVIWVTSLAESGEGTLRAALDIDEPRIIRFAIAGEIWINDVLRIRYPYVTIDGSSAPSPGISIFGDQVRILTHDVIIRDIRIRTGARSLGTSIFKLKQTWKKHQVDLYHKFYHDDSITYKHFTDLWCQERVPIRSDHNIHYMDRVDNYRSFALNLFLQTK